MFWRIFQLVVLALSLGVSQSKDCGPKFDGKCSCGFKDHDTGYKYVVNCTNEGFNDTKILENLPPEVQVLIFVGNNISEVPWNIFGTIDNLENLRVVDMSNNHLKEIKGKTYHKVQYVERLILNHNELIISYDDDSENNHHHPRMFSNFLNLRELHLTNAFADNTDAALADDLHDIFVSSNLSKLYKLHLEQNEINTLRDRRVFCDLPNLHDLYLGDNSLTDISFNITCLNHLRFLDLQNNQIETLTKREVGYLETVHSRNESNFSVDLTGNPFLCNCGIVDFIAWLKSTSVIVRNKQNLVCIRSKRQPGAALLEVKLNACNGKIKSKPPRTERTALGLLIFTTIFVLSLMIILIYINRYSLHKKVTPFIESITKKVQYTTIRNRDNVDDINLVENR